MKKVLILGASAAPSRYSNKAMRILLEHGHQVVLVSPKYDKIDDHKCYHSLSEVTEVIDVLTMYVGPGVSSELIPEIIKLAPKIVIFNPGSENPELYQALEKNSIRFIEACTLVLLRTNQFESLLFHQESE